MSATHVVRARRPRSPLRAPRRATSGSELEAHLADAAGFRGTAAGVSLPENEGEWAWLLSSGEVVLPVGAQSSLTGGATPAGGIVAATSPMNRILAMDDHSVRVEAGVPVARLVEALAERDLTYPPVPTHAGAFAGGIVATNAAGATTFKHGTTRDWVRGLTVVLPGGDVLDLERGAHRAHPDGFFELVRTNGIRTRVAIPSYRMPDVPKRSAGLHAEPEMDLVDLFVGSEGTLGVVTEVELRVLPQLHATLGLLVPFRSSGRALGAVGVLRGASRATWASRDPRGIDVSAIENVDARCVRLLREEGAPLPAGASFSGEHEMVLLILVDLPRTTGAEDVQEQVAALDDPTVVAPVTALLRVLRDHGACLDEVVLALPGDARRLTELLAFREAVPAAVNTLVRRLQRDVDPRIQKVGGDVIVPFDRLPELSRLCQELPAAAGLDVATWGHVSDGNLHPNVLPRTAADVALGERVQLELGRRVIRMGGCPMAEHGVGRHPVKQRLLLELYGAAGLAEMKAVKAALDPLGVLSGGIPWTA